MNSARPKVRVDLLLQRSAPRSVLLFLLFVCVSASLPGLALSKPLDSTTSFIPFPVTPPAVEENRDEGRIVFPAATPAGKAVTPPEAVSAGKLLLQLFTNFSTMIFSAVYVYTMIFSAGYACYALWLNWEYYVLVVLWPVHENSAQKISLLFCKSYARPPY